MEDSVADHLQTLSIRQEEPAKDHTQKNILEKRKESNPPVKIAMRDNEEEVDGNNSTGNFEETILHVPDRLKFETEMSETVENKLDEDDNVSERFEAFNSWLMDNGAKYPDLYMKRYTGDVRGVHAQNRIPPYSCIVEIPFKCLITDHMGRTETEIGKKLFSSNFNLSTPNLIAVIIYILTTREDPSHFFQPYYRILPKDYGNFPIFWNEEQLSWLKGSPIIDDILDRKRNMETDYDEVCRVCPEFRRFSFNEFLEIRTAVGSRNFGIVIHGNKRTAMVPFSDMLNHYRPRETSWTFEDSKDAFTITSLSALLPQQQVMDSYGKKCNSKFFLHYGFAVECNREEDGKCQNEMYIRLSLDRDDALVDNRMSFMGHTRMSRGFRISMNIEDRSTLDALSYCRVATATEDELQKLIAQVNPGSSRPRYSASLRDGAVSFISVANEIAALEMFARFCEEQLSRYPDSFLANETLLDSGTVGPFTERRSALLVILGEQEICRFWINAFEKVSALLKLPDGETAKHIILRAFPRDEPAQADLARYASRLGYEIRMHQ